MQVLPFPERGFSPSMADPGIPTRLLAHVRQQASTLLLIAAVLWGVEVLDAGLRWLTSLRLDNWGILPREISGLKGILLAPLLHVDFNHLTANCVPLLVLASMVLLEGRTQFWKATIAIVLLNGAAVWCLGQSDSVYIGASGVVFGYLGYVFMRAWVSRKPMWVALAIGSGIVYGGLAASLLTFSKGVSWLGHISGMISGMLAAQWFHSPSEPVGSFALKNELHDK